MTLNIKKKETFCLFAVTKEPEMSSRTISRLDGLDRYEFNPPKTCSDDQLLLFEEKSYYRDSEKLVFLGGDLYFKATYKYHSPDRSKTCCVKSWGRSCTLLLCCPIACLVGIFSGTIGEVGGACDCDECNEKSINQTEHCCQQVALRAIDCVRCTCLATPKVRLHGSDSITYCQTKKKMLESQDLETLDIDPTDQDSLRSFMSMYAGQVVKYKNTQFLPFEMETLNSSRILCDNGEEINMVIICEKSGKKCVGNRLEQKAKEYIDLRLNTFVSTQLSQQALPLHEDKAELLPKEQVSTSSSTYGALDSSPLDNTMGSQV